MNYSVYIASCDVNGGIYHYKMNDSGETKYISKVNIGFPMFLTIENNKLFAILRKPFPDSNNSGLIVYDLDEEGNPINPSDIISTMGEVACHLTIDNGEVYCANYISGSVIKMPGNLVTHSGHSIHKTRQTSPHTHFVCKTPDNKYICAVDLGIDKIIVYEKNLKEVSNASVPAGHGARHIVFSPDGKTAFCINELKSTVTVFEYHDGKLNAKSTFNALPGDFAGENTAAAIRLTVDGKILLTSNRGHDSISLFKVDNSNLSFYDNILCGGKSPRDFNITPDGKFIICTNESSDNVTFFNFENDKLKKLSIELNVKSPLCVIFN